MVFRYMHDGSSGRASRVSEVRGDGIEGRKGGGEERRGEEKRRSRGGAEADGRSRGGDKEKRR